MVALRLSSLTRRPLAGSAGKSREAGGRGTAETLRVWPGPRRWSAPAKGGKGWGRLWGGSGAWRTIPGWEEGPGQVMEVPRRGGGAGRTREGE